VRKLRFESIEVMKEWQEQVRNVTNEMILDWGDGAGGRITTVLREQMAE